MPDFLITTTARATIRERWKVTAPDEAAARAVLEDGAFRDDVILEPKGDDTVGDEEDREVQSVEPWEDE